MTPLESLLDWLQRTYNAYFLPGEESESDSADEGDDTSNDDSDGSEDESTEENEAPPDPTPEPQTDGGGAVDNQIVELQQELNDAKGHASDNENKISRLERELEEADERLETLEERSEQMLGMYDALAARINPFVDGDFASIPHESDDMDGPSLTPEEEATPEPDSDEDENEEGDDGEDDGTDNSTMEMFEETEDMEDENESPDEESESQNTDTPSDEFSDIMSEDDEFFEEFERAHEYGLLEEVPDTDRADDVVTRWLVDLLNEGGVESVRIALKKYKEVGWLGSKAHTQLDSRLKSRAALKDEFNSIEGEDEDADESEDDGEEEIEHEECLSNEMHERSYAYVVLLKNCQS